MTRGRWFIVGISITLVLAIVTYALREREPEPTHYFAAFANVDADLERRLRKAWPIRRLTIENPAHSKFDRVAREPGADLAILKILVERFRGATGGDSKGPRANDAEREPVGMALREVAGPEVVRLMLEVFPDKDFHSAFRRTMVVALCKPGRDPGPLVERALDRQENNELRRALLMRLPRIEAPAPVALRALLYQPFGRLDEIAAATLARMGDTEAPSLILRSYEEVGTDHELLYHLVQATERITGEPLEFSKRARIRRRGREAWERFSKERADRFRAVLSSWMAGRTIDTEFERGYRVPPARLETVDDVLAAGDDFDLAEASVRLAGWDTWNLVRVDQLARFLRPKLEAARTPAEKIKILNTWILKDHVVFTNLSAPDVQLSFLPYVFSQDAGNCVGYTTLYLALGQRLGLPLHGVLIPGHAFVRWEDGTFRRNIEPMFRGTEVGNAYYRASPHQLRNRTPREVLSVVLSNAAALSLRFGNYESAREECEVALRLDPSNAAARNNYVLCMLHASLDERERIDTLLEELRTRSPDDAEPWLLQSSIHAAFNEHDEALQAAHEAVRREESDRTRGWRARCYARLGQLDRAKNDLQRLENAEPFGDLRLELRVRDNPAGAVQSITQSLATAGHDRLRRITRAAEVLLEIREPAQALVVLDMGREHSERSLKDEFIQTGGVAAPDMLTREGARRRWHLVRAKALHAEGRKSEARAALATAKKHGHGGRLTLEVERLLESR